MFIGNSHYYKVFGTKVIDGNFHCSKYDTNHQWFSLCQIWYKSPMRGDFFHIWYNEIWVQKKKYHSLGICLIFGTMKSESRKKIPLIGDLSHIWDRFCSKLKYGTWKNLSKNNKILLIGDLCHIWYIEKFYWNNYRIKNIQYMSPIFILQVGMINKLVY